MTDKSDEEKTSTNNDDDKPLSWKVTKQSVFFTTRLPSKAREIHQTRSSSQNMMEVSLDESKYRTHKKKNLKNKVVVDFDLATTNVEFVEKSKKTESDS